MKPLCYYTEKFDVLIVVSNYLLSVYGLISRMYENVHTTLTVTVSLKTESYYTKVSSILFFK